MFVDITSQLASLVASLFQHPLGPFEKVMSRLNIETNWHKDVMFLGQFHQIIKNLNIEKVTKVDRFEFISRLEIR